VKRRRRTHAASCGVFIICCCLYFTFSDRATNVRELLECGEKGHAGRAPARGKGQRRREAGAAGRAGAEEIDGV